MSSDTVYGIPATDRTNAVEWAEHAIINGVAAKKVYPITLNPLTQTNPSLVLTQTDNVVASTKIVSKTISGVTYQKTLSYNAAGLFLSATVWA
jgi:hypothetical protein